MSGDFSPTGFSEQPFRKLSKNDIYQSTEQLRERTILRLGDISGQWASWVDTDSVPKVPSVGPQPPVKPSSESLMTHLKNAIRARRPAKLIEADARVSKSEGNAPEP